MMQSLETKNHIGMEFGRMLLCSVAFDAIVVDEFCWKSYCAFEK